MKFQTLKPASLLQAALLWLAGSAITNAVLAWYASRLKTENERLLFERGVVRTQLKSALGTPNSDADVFDLANRLGLQFRSLMKRKNRLPENAVCVVTSGGDFVILWINEAEVSVEVVLPDWVTEDNRRAICEDILNSDSDLEGQYRPDNKWLEDGWDSDLSFVNPNTDDHNNAVWQLRRDLAYGFKNGWIVI